MRNTGLQEAQAGIKIARRNINNLRCRWHHPYGRKWRSTKESLYESGRGEWKCWPKLNIQKINIMVSSAITSLQTDGETVAELISWDSKITADGDCSHEIERHLLLGKKVMTNLDSIVKSRDSNVVANKGPSSQGYGFSSSHVWMWELDCEESWTPKNWCYWTVVLEKTLWVPLTARRSNQFILK